MVKISLFILFTSISGLLYSQTDTLEDISSFMVIDQAPYYKIDKNGINNPNYDVLKLKEFIDSNLCYSELDTTDSIVGSVYISFWIDTTGNTYNHKIIRGVRKDLNNEALRVAKLIKFERPAMQRGKPIKIRYTVPVEFKLPKQGKPHRRCK